METIIVYGETVVIKQASALTGEINFWRGQADRETCWLQTMIANLPTLICARGERRNTANDKCAETQPTIRENTRPHTQQLVVACREVQTELYVTSPPLLTITRSLKEMKLTLIVFISELWKSAWNLLDKTNFKNRMRAQMKLHWMVSECRAPRWIASSDSKNKEPIWQRLWNHQLMTLRILSKSMRGNRATHCDGGGGLFEDPPKKNVAIGRFSKTL